MRDNNVVYLKQNLMAEPLINQWYAWSYLVSPATSSMYMANSHLKIMQSFVASPQVHVAALKNPEMIGGPFINYEPTRAAEIKALLEKTSRDAGPLLELAEAIKTLDNVLAEQAQGYSLEPMYRAVPDTLRGYIELVYDLNNKPSLRFIEGLLYESPYYDRTLQSMVFSLIDKDDRSFAFSTPRLTGNGHLHLNVSFDQPGLDELFKMKRSPQPLGHIKEVLGVAEKDLDLFSSFFTEGLPRTSPDYNGDGVRVRYFGHACLLIETRNTRILCDPVISYQCENGIERYTYADLPDTIDYILLTHNHQDHCLYESLLQLRHKTRNLIVPKNNGGGLSDPSLKLALRYTGFDNVTEIDELETIEVEDGFITGLPFLGEHADLNIRTKIAWLINLKGKSIMCAADSNNIEPKLYEHIHRLVGNVDLIFLGMECAGAPMTWLYGPLLTRPLSRKMDQSRRFDGSDAEKAIEIVEQMRPKDVYVYAMGQEPWLTYLTSIQYTEESRPIVESNKLVEYCKSRGIVSDRLFGRKEMIYN